MQIKDLSKELKITNKELIAFFKDNGYEVKNHLQATTEEMEELARGSFDKPTVIEEVKPVVKQRTFSQTEPILCRSVTPGWLGMPGKSGQLYVFTNAGDEQEVEYQDLFALKNSKSAYIYDPLIVIEDEELLEQPRWKDLASFYSEKVYGMDDIEYVLNVPVNQFKQVLESLPKGMKKAVAFEISKRMENGTFDSLKKINILDDVCGTDFKHMIQY